VKHHSSPTAERLARDFGPRAWRLAYAFLGRAADAEDAVQAAFLEIANRPGSVPADARWPWFAAVVRNKARELRRGQSRRERRESEPAAVPSTPADPVEAAVAAELAGRVRLAIDELNDDERDALLLTTVSGLTHAEAARALGAPTSTISTRVARALERVRARVGASSAGIVPFVSSLPAPAPIGGIGAATVRWASTATTAAPVSAGASIVGGIVVTKKISVAVVLVLLALLYGATSGGWFSDDAPIDDDGRRLTAGDATDEDTPPPDNGTAEGTEPDEETAPPADDAPAAGDSNLLEVSFLPNPAPRVPWSEQWSGKRGGDKATRADGTSFGPGGRGGITVPRWASPPPPKGHSTVSGLVTDDAGGALAGAKVYRIAATAKPSLPDGQIYSFEFLKEIATTDADGRFEANELIAGSFRVVANHRRLMNRSRGMDCSGAQNVIVSERATKSGVALVVPVVAEDLGVILLTVLDHEGTPVKRAWTFGGYQEGFTDAAGLVKFPDLPPGRVTVRVQRTGYKSVARPVDVPRGTTVELTVQLELEKAGGQSIGGRVVDENGDPVANAHVYIGSGNGTLRRGKTDADGRYGFDDLPAELPAGADVTIWMDGYKGANVRGIELPRQDIDFALVPLLALRVRVVDATTGEPIVQYNIDVTRDDTSEGEIKKRYVAKSLVWDENGEHAFTTIPGRHRIWLEAPDREPIEVAVEMPDESGEQLAIVEWPAR